MYPDNDLDRNDQLTNLVSNYWSMYYEGRDFVQDILESRVACDKQTHAQLQELISCLSREKVEIYNTYRWLVFGLSQNRATTDYRKAYKYGEAGINYDPFGGLSYGDDRSKVLRWAIPAHVTNITLVTNRISDPTVVWVNGVDFYLENNDIVFVRDPFEYDFSVSDVYENNEPTDRVLTMWLYGISLDTRRVFNQFGYAVEMPAIKSTKSYKQAVNAVYDSLIEGPTRHNVEKYLAALGDVPLAEGDEIVEVIGRDFIATDKNVYHISAESTPNVTVGDTLSRGQTLNNALSFHYLQKGDVPAELHGVLVEGTFGFHYGQLVFENKDVLPVVTYPGGITRFEFPLGGDPEAVKLFWDSVHELGVATGETLAQKLAVGGTPGVQPTEFNLPAVINPLQFLVENVFRYHVIIAFVRPKLFGADALPSTMGRLLRKIVPPHKTVLIVAEATIRGDNIDPELVADSTTAGVEESQQLTYGQNLEESIDPATVTAENVKIRYTSEY